MGIHLRCLSLLLVDLEGLDLELSNYQHIQISILEVNEKRESTMIFTLEVSRISNGLITRTRAFARVVSRISPIATNG